MVLLTLTVAGKAAVDEYCRIRTLDGQDDERSESLSSIELGNPIEHNDLVDISRFLLSSSRNNEGGSTSAKQWRLDTILKGASVYQPPPTPKPEPTSEYKALMRRLRQEEEQRQYEMMLNPPPAKETFNQRFPAATSSPGYIPKSEEEDEVTYADINRQMALIINVLVSIIACSVAIWIAARRWEVHKRLALSMFGSGLVAAAEVAIYLGYVRRIKDARQKERENVERKEVVETWVFEGKKGDASGKGEGDGVRFRKGKHR